MTKLWFFKHCNVYGMAGLQCIKSVFLKTDWICRAGAPPKLKIFKSRFLWDGDIIKMARRFLNIVYLRSRTQLKTWNSVCTFFPLLLVFSYILLSQNSHGTFAYVLASCALKPPKKLCVTPRPLENQPLPLSYTMP